MWKYYASLIMSLENVGWTIYYSSCNDKYLNTCLRMRDRVASVIISFRDSRVTFSVNSVVKEIRHF